MSAMVVPLEAVEYTWAESASPRMRAEGRSILTPVGVRRRPKIELSGGVERLRTVAMMVWFGWLIVAGLVVGGTALVVVIRLAFAVLGWAVSL